MAPSDPITLESLMGGMVIEESPKETAKRQKSVVVKGKGVDEDPMLWGLPGHMTQDEATTFLKFRETVEERGGEFRDTVYSFGEIEGEAWALSRWCRARKFVYEDIVKMVEEATQVRKDAKSKEFYPNPIDALGCEPSIFFAQYPQLYSGVAKNGAPVFISKPGILNVDGMECITTLDGIIQFHWYIMMHDFANRLRAQKAANPEFKKFECFCVLDLNNLTSSQLSRRALAIIKEQSAIDSICFPETMSKMLIINVPTFFSATWRIIKGWIDPRTANKIEVISSKATAEKRLRELVNEDQLPSDYGGKGPDTNVTLQESLAGDSSRLATTVMYLRGHGSEVFQVSAGEQVEVTVYTRSTAGAKFTITDADKKSVFVEHVEVKHNGTSDTNEKPSSALITKDRISGPVNIKIKADSNAGRFSTQNFLLVAAFYKK